MDRFVAMEKFSTKVTAAQAIANAVVFTCPYVPTGMIAQVLTVTTGALYVTGVTVLYADGKITVAGTDLTENDIVTVIAFDAN